jgi:hypothetical protein
MTLFGGITLSGQTAGLAALAVIAALVVLTVLAVRRLLAKPRGFKGRDYREFLSARREAERTKDAWGVKSSIVVRRGKGQRATLQPGTLAVTVDDTDALVDFMLVKQATTVDHAGVVEAYA